MKNINFILILAILFPGLIFGQKKPADCRKIKEGIYYIYPPNYKAGFQLIRNGDTQIEINNTTKDSSFWKIQWPDDCTCYAKFIRKNVPESTEFLQFLNTHTAFFKVLSVTKDYYIFKIGLDSANNRENLIDTAWYKPR